MLKLLLDAVPMVKEIERGLGHGTTRKTTFWWLWATFVILLQGTQLPVEL